MNSNDQDIRNDFAEELAHFAWTHDDSILQRTITRVKRNLRDRVHDGSFIPAMSAGAWFRIADLASKISAEVDGPFESVSSGGKYAHPRQTRRMAAALMADHYNKHLEVVAEEIE